MLKIKNDNFKKYGMPFILSCFGIGGMFLFSYLTFLPNRTFAESLIIDPNEHRSLSQISTMQEMSQQVCINSREEETKQLTDTRDNKTYWVAKLKDGNCWMTQNLDYNGGGTSTEISNWPRSGTAANYNDPGDYIYTYPGHGQVSDNTCSGVTSITASGCTSYFTAKNASSDLHYHVGNYYSWNAATNGTGNAITSGEPSGSICPDGWKLPTGNNTSKGSLAYLLAQYGVQSSITGTSIDGKTYQIYSNPLYFVYNGHIGGDRTLVVAGYGGYYWLSTPNSNGVGAYGLSFYDASGVGMSGGNQRYYGFAVRCLTTGGWLDSYPELLDDDQANVSITVSPVISIDATSGMDEDVDFTKVATGNISASISSNQPYQVLLSTAQTALEQSPVLENHNIPMITADQDVIAGTSSWGIKKKLSATTGVAGDITDASLYSPIGVNDDKALFFKSASAESKILNFAVGIAVAPELPSGKYSTQVTITAVAN